MALKYRVKKSIYEAMNDVLKGEYKVDPNNADDYILDVDGAVDKTRLDEFRNNNIELQRKIDLYKDIDPAKHRELLEEQRKIQEKQWIEAGEVDKVVEGRVNTMKSSYEGTIKEKDTAINTMSRQLEVLTIDNQVREQATKLGVQPSAVDDVLLRAKTVYRLVEGKPVPKDQEDKVIFGKDGSNPMPISEYVAGLKETAPHLFQPSSGSGANHGRLPGGGQDTSKMTATQKIAAGLTSGGQSEFVT